MIAAAAIIALASSLRPDPRPRPQAPYGANGSKWLELNAGRAIAMKIARATSLIPTSTRLTVALSREPIASRQATASEITTAGQVDESTGKRPGQQRFGHGPAGRADYASRVARPADRDGTADHGVFEDQRPADDPREQLAERDVGVRVGATGHRHHRGHLCVRERCGRADDTATTNDKICRSRHARADAGQGVDAGADDATARQARPGAPS